MKRLPGSAIRAEGFLRRAGYSIPAVLCLFMTSACTVHTYDDMLKERYPAAFYGDTFTAWLWERLTPRPLKRGPFSTPFAYNQQEELTDLEVARRELRNGTHDARVLERRSKENEWAYNTAKYRSWNTNRRDYERQFDVGDRSGSAYGQGFEDGCRTFSSAIGAGTWRLIGPQYNIPRMLSEQWYSRGFSDGTTFCSSRTDWNLL